MTDIILTRYQAYRRQRDERIYKLFVRNKTKYSTVKGLYTFIAERERCSVMTVYRVLAKYGVDGVAGKAVHHDDE